MPLTASRRLAAALVALAACSSAAPAPKPVAAPAAAPVPADAAVDAAPDAGVSDAVLHAPAWVFRFTTAERKETWTLQFAGGQALLVVASATGTQRYLGTATEGPTVTVDVATATAKLALSCKHAHRAIGTKCNDTRAKPVDVLDCYHPDFKEPMPFGPAPGVEYAVSAACTGYRLAAP